MNQLLLRTSSLDLIPHPERSSGRASGRTRESAREPNDEAYRLPGFMEMEIHKEAEFKLVFQCMRRWKRYVKYRKQLRQQESSLMKMLMQAINFHEQKLGSRVFRSLRLFRKKFRKINNAELAVKQIVSQNLKAFYFQQMQRRFLRERRRKYLKKVAHGFFREQRKFKCLLFWHREVKKLKKINFKIQKKIKSKVPYAAELLLEVLAPDAFPSCALSENTPYISKIVQFHFFALENLTVPTLNDEGAVVAKARVRPHQVHPFTSSVEFILLQKQKRIFRRLKQWTAMAKACRSDHYTRLVVRTFAYLKRKAYQRKVICHMHYRNLEILRLACFKRLLEHSQRQANLREAQGTVAFAHQGKVQAKFFHAWRSVFAYYSSFTKSTYNYSDKRASDLKFKAKYFRHMKQYLRMRQIHKANVAAADRHYFGKFIRVCFTNWAWYSGKEVKVLRFGRVELTKKYKREMRARYFSALVRVYQNQVNARSFSRVQLMKKAFNSLAHRKQYLRLKDQVSTICDQQYRRSLQTRGWKSLTGYAKRQQQLYSLFQLLVARQKQSLVTRALIGLHHNVQKRRQKLEDLELLATLHRTNVLRKVYIALNHFSEQRKDRSYRAAVIRRVHEKRTERYFFGQILCLLRRRQHDSKAGRILTQKTQSKLISYCFVSWATKYKFLKIVEESSRVGFRPRGSDDPISARSLKELGDPPRVTVLPKKGFSLERAFAIQRASEVLRWRRARAVGSDYFKLWKSHLSLRREFRFRRHCLEEKIRIRSLQEAFEAFTGRVREKLRQSERKRQADFFRRRSFLLKAESVLRTHAYFKRVEREIIQAYRTGVKAKVLDYLKYRWNLKTRLRAVLGQKAASLKVSIFTALKTHAEDEKKHREKQDFFDSDEAVRHLEKWKLARILDVLNDKVETRRIETRKIRTIQKTISDREKKEVIRIWRTELYLVKLNDEVAVPYYETTLQPRHLLAVFKSLKDYALRKKDERRRGSRAALYFRDSLLTKAYESLRWYANTQIRRKRSIQYLQINLSRMTMSQCFQALKSTWEKKMIEQDLTATIFMKRKQKVEQEVFAYWKKAFKAIKELEPAFEFVDQRRERMLKEKIFGVLKEYSQIRTEKAYLASRAQSYTQELLIRKAFESLVWQMEVSKRKRILQALSEVQFKKMIMTRWLSALNKKAERRDLLSPKQLALLETGTKDKESKLMKVDMGEPTHPSNKYKRRARTFSRTKSSLMTFAKVGAPTSFQGTATSLAGGDLHGQLPTCEQLLEEAGVTDDHSGGFAHGTFQEGLGTGFQSEEIQN